MRELPGKIIRSLIIWLPDPLEPILSSLLLFLPILFLAAARLALNKKDEHFKLKEDLRYLP